MNHLGTVFLETERLILRPFRKTDVEDMYNNWASSDNVTKFLTWPSHSSKEISKKVVDLWVSNIEDLRSYQWCIEWKENHQAIGSLSVVQIDEAVDAVEIGYCIGEAYWHMGIMAEAFKEVIKFLFEKVGCNRIYAKHDVLNPNSGRVMKKAGLKYEGRLLEAGKNNTGICDLDIYGLTKSMYSKSIGEA